MLEAPAPGAEALDFRQISGGFLVQAPHTSSPAATTGGSSPRSRRRSEQWRDLELAWRICGHVKSNAIVLVKDGQAVGIGAGQQNRVESGEIAAKKAAGRAAGGACASDAFYPFPDGVEAAAAAGVAAVIQPGGAMRDDAMIETRRRARARDGVHRRAALPPLMAAIAPRRQRVPRPREGRPARARIKALGERGVTPGLGTILVGDDPNSAAYIRGKRADSAEVGIDVVPRRAARRRRRRPKCSPRSTTFNDEPGRRRVHRAAAAARRPRRRGRAARDRSRQGRRRPAPGEPRPARDRCVAARGRARRSVSRRCSCTTTSRSKAGTS